MTMLRVNYTIIYNPNIIIEIQGIIVDINKNL